MRERLDFNDLATSKKFAVLAHSLYRRDLVVF